MLKHQSHRCEGVIDDWAVIKKLPDGWTFICIVNNDLEDVAIIKYCPYCGAELEQEGKNAREKKKES